MKHPFLLTLFGCLLWAGVNAQETRLELGLGYTPILEDGEYAGNQSLVRAVYHLNPLGLRAHLTRATHMAPLDRAGTSRLNTRFSLGMQYRIEFQKERLHLLLFHDFGYAGGTTTVSSSDPLTNANSRSQTNIATKSLLPGIGIQYRLTRFLYLGLEGGYQLDWRRTQETVSVTRDPSDPLYPSGYAKTSTFEAQSFGRGFYFNGLIVSIQF